MTHQFLKEQREETRLTIHELLKNGSDPEALYTIEHHLSGNTFDTLEKVVVEALKLGYEVTNLEELEVESGEILICCDAVSKISLKVELIDAQVEELFTMAQHLGVHYDGWGTYFEDPDGDDKARDEFDQSEEHNLEKSVYVPATRH